MSTFQVSILAADRDFYEGPCESLVIPTLQGQYGILAHHRNLIAAVVPGTLHYKVPDKPEQIAAVSAGLIKVENNEVLILVDSAERPEDIDVNRASARPTKQKRQCCKRRASRSTARRRHVLPGQ